MALASGGRLFGWQPTVAMMNCLEHVAVQAPERDSPTIGKDDCATLWRQICLVECDAEKQVLPSITKKQRRSTKFM